MENRKTLSLGNIDLSKLNEKLENVVFKKKKTVENPKNEVKKSKKPKRLPQKKVLTPEEKKMIEEKKEEYIKKGYRKADYIDWVLYKCDIRQRKTMPTFIKNNGLQPYQLPYCKNLRYKLEDYYTLKRKTGIKPIIDIENEFRKKSNKPLLNPNTIIEKYNRYLEKMGHEELKEKI